MGKELLAGFTAGNNNSWSSLLCVAVELLGHLRPAQKETWSKFLVFQSPPGCSESTRSLPVQSSLVTTMEPYEPMLGYSRVKPQPTYRRALGELTNTPLLLSPGAAGLSPRAPHPSPRLSREEGGLATPPKSALTPSSPDTITPTHNLKLLTELASKMPGAVASSARQTLQFEDQEPSLGGGRGRALLLGENADGSSPHKDHSYLPRVSVPSTATFREQLAPRSTSSTPRSTPTSVSPCPPTMAEKGNRKDKSLGILAERMLASLPYAMGAGEGTELQLDDTARVLNTERRRIYDIVNVFEAVQIMSKVSSITSFNSLFLTPNFRLGRMCTSGTAAPTWSPAWPGCGSSPPSWVSWSSTPW